MSPQRLKELEAIIEEYPFFQAVRALHLKGLKNLDSYQYHKTLKVTAAYTADREVLFLYINAIEFEQHIIANTIASRLLKPETQKINRRYLTNFQRKTSLSQPQDAQTLSSNNNPASYTKRERHSFMEWLQLTDNLTEETEAPTIGILEKKKKFDLLDKFIQNNPKIVPKEKITAKIDLEASTTLDKNELMTETLARVYLEQKKYKKAIQAFNILGLKYPEKSGFFADQIRLAQQLQKESE